MPRICADKKGGNNGLMKRLVPGAALILMLVWRAGAQAPAECYRVEDVPTPPGIAPEVSAIAFGKDGKLYAAFRRGYIYALDLRTMQWKKFASGLQTPLGILPGRPGEFFIGHLPELTRIADSDGD